MQKGLIVGVLTKAGIKQDKIAEVAGISLRSVPEYLKQVRAAFPLIDDVDYYKESREMLIAVAESAALKSTVEKLAEPSSDSKLRERAYAFSVMHHAGRLERNASTANIHTKTQYTEVELEDYEDTPSE